MSVLDAVAAGRRAAEALMFDACVITAAGARPVFNTTTGEYTASPGDEVYAGPCKVQTRMPGDATPEAGGQQISVVVLELHVPVSAADIAVGQQAVITSCLMDPELVGHRFRITVVPAKSFATARRLRCEETTS